MAIVKLREKQKSNPRKPKVGDIVTIFGDKRDETTKTLLRSGSAVVIANFVVEKGIFGEDIESYIVTDMSGEQFSKQLSESELWFIKDYLKLNFWAFGTSLFVIGLYVTVLNTIVIEMFPALFSIYWGLVLIPALLLLILHVMTFFIPLARACKEYFLFRKRDGE